MFDTIKLKHYRKVLENYDFQNHWKTAKKSKYLTWVFNPEKNVPLPRIAIYRTETLWHIETEVSAPKMLFGHNARLLNKNEWNEVLGFISDYVEVHSGLPFNAKTALVARVDFAKDIQLSTSSEVRQMLKRLAAQTLTRTDKLFYNDETLYFKALAQNRSIRIYDKLKEVLNQKNPNREAMEYAKDKLRVEYLHLKPDWLNRLVKRLSLPDRTAKSLLTQEVSDFAINEVFESLNFGHLRTNDKPLMDILRQTFGTAKAMNLYGFLEAVSLYGEHFYKDESFKFSKDNYDYRAKHCRKAKVWKKPYD